MLTTISGRNWLLIGALLAAAFSNAIPAMAGNLTNDSFALTQAGACKDVCPATTLRDFGFVSFGQPDTGNGLDFAQTINAPDHFGLDARGSANTTDPGGHGSGWSSITFQNSLLIPAQQGIVQGSLGTLKIPYHLDGTVAIDWAEVFSGGFLVSGATAKLRWDYQSFDIAGTLPFTDQVLENRQWSGNHVSDTVNDNLQLVIPFHFGEIFYLAEEAYVTVDGHSGDAPSIGSVEADFFHTGTIGPAIVLDSNGNPLTNPVIQSDTGFDFANPNAAVATPEPGTFVLASVMLLLLAAKFISNYTPSAAKTPSWRVSPDL